MTASVADELARKIALEKRVQPELSRFFRLVGQEAITIWVATGRPPQLGTYREELTVLLRHHYRRVAKTFRSVVRDGLKAHTLVAETKEEEQGAEEELTALLLAAIATRSALQSDRIIRTTERDLSQAIEDATVKVALTDADTSRPALAPALRQQYATDTQARVTTIATTETQAMAEQTKEIAATVASGVAIGAALRPRPLIKVWHTNLDEKTRMAHVRADLQKQPRSSPFVVGGETLMYPGDTSLGASLWNVINCRCTVQYVRDNR